MIGAFKNCLIMQIGKPSPGTEVVVARRESKAQGTDIRQRKSRRGPKMSDEA